MPPPSSRIPPLLQPYTQLPPDGSLVLLTGVLGASTNWLVIRYICGALAQGSNAGVARRTAPANASTHGRQDANGEVDGAAAQDGPVAVILVSFLRDWDFWKTEGRRAGGLDLARLAQQNRFAFVDGLSSLFLPAPQIQTQQQQHRAANAVPIKPTATTTPPTFSLTSPTLSHLSDTIQQASTHLSPQKTLLILDAPDLLLAAADPNAITASTLSSTLLALRASVHATILTLAADAPLVAAAAEAASAFTHSSPAPNASLRAPLEAAHAAFTIGQAHVADWVLSLRLLDTGFAADVSGVLRIYKGGIMRTRMTESRKREGWMYRGRTRRCCTMSVGMGA